jgi:putative Holliday junction resolvase
MAEAASDPGTVCVLGFDVGARRIGVAVGNTVSLTARALAMVEVGDAGPDWRRIEALVQEWRPGRLVVGEPLTLEGTTQPATERARGFARQLGRRTALPVDLVDERSTSREADRRFAERRRQGTARRRDAASLDAVAAEIIVERWLQRSTAPVPDSP